jgi:hypothetical protein
VEKFTWRHREIGQFLPPYINSFTAELEFEINGFLSYISLNICICICFITDRSMNLTEKMRLTTSGFGNCTARLVRTRMSFVPEKYFHRKAIHFFVALMVQTF